MAQQNVIEKPDLHALPTISDRMTFIYLEHCKVSRENGAVTATDLDGTVYIPAAAITLLLLGPGTLFPAYAGVILLYGLYLSEKYTFPRIRGGDPNAITTFYIPSIFSPHTQGYTISKKAVLSKHRFFQNIQLKPTLSPLPYTLRPSPP